MGDGCSGVRSDVVFEAASPRLDLDKEIVRGVCRFGVPVRLSAVDVPHFVGESLLLGVLVREKECD